MVKNLSVNAGDRRVVGLIPGLGRSTGRGHWKFCCDLSRYNFFFFF